MKQVRLAETVTESEVNTVAADTPPNEILMMSSAALSLDEAFQLSTKRAATEHEIMATPGATAEKALVGALDSACNRTCAGETWLQNYVAMLHTAPPWIQGLVAKAPETERFRFGNGAVLPSATRWRIPISVADEIVLLWVSSVEVPSLGLLIGRDVLDAVGGLLDFANRTLTCRIFEAKPTPLSQLAAGHLALQLLPEAWPAEGREKWRRLGPDGVIEILSDCKTWARHLMKRPTRTAASASEAKGHDHNLTEASLTLGRFAFEYNSVLFASAQEMCSSTATAVCPEASSPTARSKDGFRFRRRCPTYLGAWLRFIWRPRGPPRRGSAQERRKVAALDSARGGALELGQGRASTGTYQAPRLALLALSLAFGVYGFSVEGAGRHYGAQRSASSPMAWAWNMDGGDPVGYDVVQEPLWPQLRLPGGSLLAGHDGRHELQGQSYEGQGSYGERGRGGGGKGGGQAPGCAEVDRAEGRASYLEARPFEARGFASCDGHREGQGGGPEGQDQTDARAFKGYVGYANLGAFGLQRFYDRLLAPFAANFRTFADHLCRAFGQSDLYACGGFTGGGVRPGGGTSEHECLHVLHGDDGPEVPEHAGAGRAAAAGHAEPGAATRDGPAEPRPGQRCRHGRLGPGAPADRRRAPDTQGPTNGAAWLPGTSGIGALKAGQRQLIHQAWARHRREQLLISCSPRQVRDALVADHFLDYKRGLNDVFVMEVPLIVAEAVASVDKVSQAARMRGHTTAGPWTAEAGWSLLLRDHRHRLLQALRRDRPYFLVMTVPAGVWDPVVRRQLSPDQLRQRQLQEVALLNFAGRLAREQIKGGRHFVFRLPLLSAAWRTPALKRLRLLPSVLSVTLATQRLLTSSQAVASCFLDKATVRRCISTASGFGSALVQAFEAEFDFETSSARSAGTTHDCYLTTTVPGSVDYFHDVLAADSGADGGGDDFSLEKDADSEEEAAEPYQGVISPAVRQAVRRVHEATGHRPPRRLARALLLSGAPPEAVQAARELKCDVCAERRAPKSRRVGSWPCPCRQ